MLAFLTLKNSNCHQVIARAIEVWGLELVSYASSDPRAVMAKRNPTYGRIALLL
jgi:hypothetical protein